MLLTRDDTRWKRDAEGRRQRQKCIRDSYEWKEIYGVMQKPAFVFDGRNILDHEHLKEIGFIVYALGKPIDPFLKSAEGA